MNNQAFEKEMEVAEIQGDIRQERGLNWVIISFAIIILTIVIVMFGARLFYKDALHQINQNSNVSASPARE